MRNSRLAIIAASVVMIMTACSAAATPVPPTAAPTTAASVAPSTAASTAPTTAPSVALPTVRIGSDNFYESKLMAEIYAQVLEHAGYTVDRHLGPRFAPAAPGVGHAPLRLHPLNDVFRGLTTVDTGYRTVGDSRWRGQDSELLQKVAAHILGDLHRGLRDPEDRIDDRDRVAADERTRDGGQRQIPLRRLAGLRSRRAPGARSQSAPGPGWRPPRARGGSGGGLLLHCGGRARWACGLELGLRGSPRR